MKLMHQALDMPTQINNERRKSTEFLKKDAKQQ